MSGPKNGGAYIFKNRLPKVGFYLGRLKEMEELKSFLDRNNLEFFFSLNQDILKLTLDCFKYGYDYENLSEEAKAEIRNYFSNPKYSEMFSEMMFDVVNHIQGVKPYDFSSRQIRHKHYSDFLIRQIGCMLIHDDGTKYYDRSENKVTEIFDYEDAIKGVHFPIDYTGCTHKSLDSVIKMILSKMKINEIGFEEKLLSEVLKGDVGSADMYAFGKYFFDKIVDSLSKHALLAGFIESDLRERLLIMIATDYLEFVNSM